MVTTPAQLGKVLAVDPGKHGLGWSVWFQAELVGCGLARAAGRDLGSLAVQLADQVPTGADVAVIERMFHYPVTGNPDPPHVRDAKANALLDLQAVGGMVAGRSGASQVIWATARDWKGQTPKDVTAHRVRKALRPPELATMTRDLAPVPPSLRHNVMDGLALGLWYLRRIPR